MKKENRVRGNLMRAKPYKLTDTGSGLKVVLSQLSMLTKHDKVYQERMDNGIILLIPEKLFLKDVEQNLEKD